MLVSEAFRSCDRFEILWRLLLVTGPADHCQAIRIVWVIGLVAQGEGRAVIENEEAYDEPCPAVGTAPVLAQHDLGSDPPRDRATLRAEKGPLSLHSRRPSGLRRRQVMRRRLASRDRGGRCGSAAW